MRVLFLCNKPPYPGRDGGAIAMRALIEGLADAGHQVSVLAVDSPKYQTGESPVPSAYSRKIQMKRVTVDLKVRTLPAVFSLVKGISYHVSRFYSGDFDQILREILQDPFDIVQIETIYPGVYLDTIRKFSRAPIILRAHNIEHLIWDQLAKNQKGLLKRFFLRKMTPSLKNFELSLFGKVDGIAAITPKETKFVELATCAVPVKTIPFGINPDRYPDIPANLNPQNLFYIGSMDWLPNQEGIRWFLEKIWPSVIYSRPQTSFLLAGRKMPDWLLRKKTTRLQIIGEVPDSWEFICNNGIMIVPLLSGSGIRIKIIEGMLAGKTVITTTKGAEGIDCQDGFNIFLADTPEEFLEKILFCLDNPEILKNIGIRAREHVLKNHNLRTIIPELVKFYDELLTFE